MVRTRTVEGRPVVDDDTICSLSASAGVGPAAITVKNASFVARLDADAAPGSAPSCAAEADPESRLALALADVKVVFDPAAPAGTRPRIAGHIELDAPVRVAHRVAPGISTLTGAVGLDLDVAYPPDRTIPDASGKLRLREVVLDEKRVLSHVTDAELVVENGVVRLPRLVASYADADVTIRKTEPIR